jgi:hypothetical protein
MPPNAAGQSPLPRPGSSSALESSTEPLFKVPKGDLAASSDAALLVDLRSRRRMTLLIAATVGIAALIVLGLGLYYTLSSDPTPDLTPTAVSPVAPAPSALETAAPTGAAARPTASPSTTQRSPVPTAPERRVKPPG